MASAEAVGAELISWVVAVLGPEAVVRTWDARRKRFVVCREAVPGLRGGSDDGDAPAAKRARAEAVLSPPPPAPAAAAAVPLPVVRGASAFPSLSGAALFTSTAFHSSPTIAEIYTSGRTLTASGASKKLDSAVGPRESRHLYHIVRDNGFTRLLEVGMANGMSALSLCQALEDGGASAAGILISLDPFQATQWDNTALAALTRAGLRHRSRLIEEKSYLALPALLRCVEAGDEPPFDVIFVDGMHLFDYTLVDLFFADLLLRVGGVLLLDDMKHNGVAPAADWVKTNLPHMRYVPDTVCSDTLGTFVKVGQDTRSWDHFNAFNASRRR